MVSGLISRIKRIQCLFILTHANEARRYVRWCRACLVALDEGKRVRVDHCGDALTREEWHAEFLKVLNKRINLKAGDRPSWRKLDPDYQTRLYRDSRRLRDMARRVRVYQFETTEARSRYADRLSQYDD